MRRSSILSLLLFLFISLLFFTANSVHAGSCGCGDGYTCTMCTTSFSCEPDGDCNPNEPPCPCGFDGAGSCNWSACGGGGGSNPTPTLPPPKNLRFSCDRSGNSAYIYWDAEASANYYSLRVNNTIDSWTGSCTDSNPADVCANVSGTSFFINVNPGYNSGWWIHSRKGVAPDGRWSSSVDGPIISCPTPAPAPYSYVQISSPNCVSSSSKYEAGKNFMLYGLANNTTNSPNIKASQIYIAKQCGTDLCSYSSSPSWCSNAGGTFALSGGTGNFCKITEVTGLDTSSTMYSTTINISDTGTYFALINTSSVDALAYACSGNPKCSYSLSNLTGKYNCGASYYKACTDGSVGYPEDLRYWGESLRFEVLSSATCNPTSTPIPPTSTPIPPTNTPIPPTSTPVPPTSTPWPTTPPVPPTSTPTPASALTCGVNAINNYSLRTSYFNQYYQSTNGTKDPRSFNVVQDTDYTLSFKAKTLTDWQPLKSPNSLNIVIQGNSSNNTYEMGNVSKTINEVTNHSVTFNTGSNSVIRDINQILVVPTNTPTYTPTPTPIGTCSPNLLTNSPSSYQTTIGARDAGEKLIWTSPDNITFEEGRAYNILINASRVITGGSRDINLKMKMGWYEYDLGYVTETSTLLTENSIPLFMTATDKPELYIEYRRAFSETDLTLSLSDLSICPEAASQAPPPSDASTVESYDYSLSYVCVATPTPSLPPPSNLTATCNATGTAATLRWNSVSGAAKYAIRMDSNTVSWVGISCSTTQNTGDICNDNVAGASYTVSVTPGIANRWWVHGVESGGNFGPSAVNTFTCIAPTNTPTRTPTSTLTPGSLSCGSSCNPNNNQCPERCGQCIFSDITDLYTCTIGTLTGTPITSLSPAVTITSSQSTSTPTKTPSPTRNPNTTLTAPPTTRTPTPTITATSSPTPLPILRITGDFRQKQNGGSAQPIPARDTDLLPVENISIQDLSTTPTNCYTQICNESPENVAYKCTVSFDSGCQMPRPNNLKVKSALIPYASPYYRNVLQPQAINNLDTDFTIPLDFVYTGEAWIRLKNTSFTRYPGAATKLINNIPYIIDTFGTNDNNTKGMIGESILGAGGFVAGDNNLVDIQPQNITSQTNNFRINSNYTLGSNSTDVKNTITYQLGKIINSKAINTARPNASSILELTRGLIYVIEGETIDVNSINFINNPGNPTLLIIKNGSEYGNLKIKSDINTSADSGPLMIIANDIELDVSLEKINAIVISLGKFITAPSASSKTLEIKGNLMALGGIVQHDGTTPRRKRGDSNNAKPTIFVDFDMEMYAGMLPLISVNEIDW